MSEVQEEKQHRRLRIARGGLILAALLLLAGTGFAALASFDITAAKLGAVFGMAGILVGVPSAASWVVIRLNQAAARSSG